jgi:PPE family
MGTYFNYDDTSHQVIFDHINGGSGSDSLQEACWAWQRLGDDVGTTGKSFVQSAIRGILTSREGASASAALAATGAMLPWMDDVALIAITAAQRAQDQADYWVTAKNSVPPVPPAPNSVGFFGDPGEWFVEKVDWFPGVTSEEETAQQRLQDAAEQARQAMRVYQSNSNGNIDLAPAFTAPQSWDASMGALPLTGPHVSDADAAPIAAGGGAGAHQASLLAAHQSAGGQPVATGSQVTGSQVTGSQVAPGGHAAPGAVGAGQWAGNLTPVQGATPSPLPIGARSGNDIAGRDSAPVRGAAAGARFAGAGRSDDAGRAGYGPHPSSAFGPRPAVSAPHPSADDMAGARGGINSAGSGSAGSGSAGSGSAGSGSVGAGSAGAGSAGAGRGSSGAEYGAPFAGGADQRGEQAREHRSKYLIHDDPHAIVGDLPPTAPPVIGEDPAY